MTQKLGIVSTIVLLLLGLSLTATTRAGDVILSNNAGGGNDPWRILGEPSLVINGFDLNALGITRPTRVDRVSISVAVAVPSETATVVVYGDTNGGSPVDATLLRQQQVTISSSGTFNVDFADPVVVEQPVLWVGFYLPVGFEFFADTSGASVLTYWAWEPGSTFDVSTLSSASVLGPSDGSAPVNLNINGIARITAELDTDNNPNTNIDATAIPVVDNNTDNDADVPIRQQVASDSGDITPPMVNYPDCLSLYIDAADVQVTYRNGIRFFCQLLATPFAPESPENYTQRGRLFDVYAFNGPPSGIATRFSSPVTHCLTPQPEDVTTAVIGLAYGVPREWEILPSVRYGTLVCAEIVYAGLISYFIPSN